MFYLQLNMKPLCEYSKSQLTCQTTADLRVEAQDWVKEGKDDLKETEIWINKKNVALEERCDHLQTQIDALVKGIEESKQSHIDKSKDTLLTKEDFALDIERYEGQFERKTAGYLPNLESDRF